jgi:hypothetical protein
MATKPGFLGLLGAALVFAVAGMWHEPFVRSVLVVADVLIALLIVGFIVWRLGTEDGVPRA